MTTSSFDPWRTRSSLLIDVRDPQDQRAWEEFHARYAPMIRGWCCQWFPRDADEMVQEVLGLLARRLQTFEYEPAKGRFRGFLKTVTNNLMADLKEKAQRSPIKGGDGLLEQVEARDDLWARLASEYDLELLEKAKETVRGRVEASTWSAYVETAEQLRRPAEVAKELGMTVGAVHQAKYQVLTLLRKEVAFLENSSEHEVSS